MTEPPTGWCRARLGEILSVTYGKALDKSRRTADGQFHYVGSGGSIARTSDRLATSETIVVGRKGTAGSVQRYADGCWPSDTTFYMEIPAGLNGALVEHQLRAARLGQHERSTALPGLGRPDLEAAVLVVPPVAEQERIVAAIEEAFSKLDAGEAGLRTVRQLLKRMREAVLAAAVTGRLVPQDPADSAAASLFADIGVAQVSGTHDTPPTWAWAALGSLLREPLRNGMSAVKADVAEGLPTFSITAVTTGDFSSANIKYTAGDWNRAEDLWAEAGDLFVQRSNTPELVGTARLYRGAPRAAIFPDLLIRVRPIRQVRPAWLEMVMRSPRCRASIRSQAKGLAGSMPKISQPVLENLAVPVPPEDEQDRIVAEVERQFSFVEACERVVDAGLARSDALRRSVLKAAFEGRLVPQDPSDEPASLLLERMRAERSACQSSTSGARRKKAEAS